LPARQQRQRNETYIRNEQNTGMCLFCLSFVVSELLKKTSLNWWDGAIFAVNPRCSRNVMKKALNARTMLRIHVWKCAHRTESETVGANLIYTAVVLVRSFFKLDDVNAHMLRQTSYIRAKSPAQAEQLSILRRHFYQRGQNK
jgi:hypothetical protein